MDLLPKTKTYETELSAYAEKNDMEIIGLETADYQLEVLNKVSLERQVEMLIQDGFSGSPLEEFNELVAVYKEQDINEMLVLFEGDSLMTEYEDELLVTRNKNWIPKIERSVKKNPTFIAVGAMHLPGEYGVLNLLRMQGYILKPVRVE
jgi:uncharacterized protein YbaP (TraB family)